MKGVWGFITSKLEMKVYLPNISGIFTLRQIPFGLDSLGAFSLWLAILGKLRTRDRLHFLSPDPICPLCQNAEESHAHLFFNCDWSSSLWRKARHWLRLHRNICSLDIATRVLHNRKKGLQPRILECILGSLVPSWSNLFLLVCMGLKKFMARNVSVFNGWSLDVHGRLLALLDDCAFGFDGCSQVDFQMPPAPGPPPPAPRPPPPAGRFNDQPRRSPPPPGAPPGDRP
ncbi:hypothetical protein NC651_033433 [Populus alba x Populus x berolinensis]|nr:hypothetical protein NC651_033433 [Populus alba x Populus x berolinensis]